MCVSIDLSGLLVASLFPFSGLDRERVRETDYVAFDVRCEEPGVPGSRIFRMLGRVGW